jgi:hypothetical protein
MANYTRLIVFIRTGKLPPLTRLERFERVFVPACLVLSFLLVVAIVAMSALGGSR